MRKFKILVLCSLILLWLSNLCIISFKFTKSDSLTIRVGAYENEPKIYTDDNGNLVGFWPDIVQYIAAQEGWNIQYVKGTWTECLARLENNEIDLMVDVAYSKERNQVYDFNNVSVFINWGIIYAREPGVLLTFEDLENKTIAVMNKSIHTTGAFGIKNLTQLFGINCTFIVLQDYYQVFEKLDNDEADAGVVNRLFGILNKDDYDVVQTSLIFNPVDLMFALPKNASLNNFLIERLNYHLKVLQDDPDSIYYQSIEKFFHQIPVIERIPDWIIFTIIIVVMLVIIFILMSVVLKRQVNQKTQELRETNAELELLNQILIETIPNGVIFIYENGAISIVNQIFKNLYYSIYDSEISPLMNIFDLPDNALVKPIKNGILKNKVIQRVGETSIKKQTISLEDSTYMELFSAKMYLERTYRSVGYLFVINDVTPFIKLEKLRQQFVSMVSHELRTPITSINMSLNNLVKYRDQLDDEQEAKILLIVKKSGEVLSEMIEDLLTASTIESETLELDKTICEISDIINELHQELETRLNEKKITLTVHIDSKIRIKCDSKRISQVFRIIIDNAVKYSPSGSEIKIQVIDNYQGPKNPSNLPGILIKFIDNGIGIPKKDIPKLFTRFYRGSNIGNVNGSGLGLNIAKILVELHNGIISVESQVGKGTTFFVFLPKIKSDIEEIK